MEASYRRPRLSVPFPVRLRRVFSILLALCVISAVTVVLLWLFNREKAVRFCGVVDSGAENIAPIETARITEVLVVPGQEVKAGDPIVSFDPAGRLMDEALTAVKIRDSESEIRQEARRLRQLVRDAEVELELKRMEQVREAAELEGYEAEIARLSPLVEKKIVSELELMALRPKADALRRIVGGYGPLLTALSNRLEQVRLDAARATVEIEARVKGDLQLADAALTATFKRDSCVLRAVSDGVVSQIFHHSGDIVMAGDPIVRLAKSTENGCLVTGMLPVDRLEAVSVGDAVSVERLVLGVLNPSGEGCLGIVEAIDLEVLDFFDPNNPAPHTPARGRKVRIRLTGDASRFIPGESVLITTNPEDGGFLSGVFK